MFVTPLCPVNTFFRQQLLCVLLVYGMDEVLTLSFFGLVHYPSSGSPKHKGQIDSKMLFGYNTRIRCYLAQNARACEKC